MAGRKVAVELELEVARYLRSGGDAAAILRVVKREANALGDELDDTSRDMDQLALNTDVAARSVDDLGDEARGTTAELLAMGAAADSAGASVRRATGDLLDQSTRFGRRTMRGFDFSQTIAEGRGQLIAGVIVALIAASPLIGAVIAGAVTGAVGAGGIIGGVAAAAQDERVKREWQRFAAGFTMEDFGGDLFVEPTIRGLRVIEDAFEDMDLRSTLSLLDDDVVQLFRGIGDAGRNFVPGLERALQRIGPFVDVFSSGLGESGRALGQFIDDVSSSEGAVMGLESLFRILNGSVVVLGKTLEGLSDIYGAYIKMQAAGAGVLEDLPGPWQEMMRVYNDVTEAMLENADGSRQVGEAIFIGAEAMTVQSRAADDLFRHLQNLNQATDDYLDNTDAMAESSDNFEESLLDLRDALRENGRTIDNHTRAGLENRDMFRRAIDDAKEERRTTIERTGAVDAANVKYAEQIRRVEALATQSGITKQALKEMAGTYDVEIVVRLNAILGNTLRLLLGNPGTGGLGAVFSTMSLLNSIGPQPAAPTPAAPALRISDLDRAGGRASGGWVLPGFSYDVGELGRETLHMFPGGVGYVQPGTSGASGSNAVRLVVEDRSSGGIRVKLIDDGLRRGVPQATLEAAYP